MTKLVTEGLTKKYNGAPIFEDVSIELHERELVCLLGVSGVGKTTLFNIISGLLVPDGGRVLLSGEDITGKAGLISYMLQKDLLLPFRTVLDNVALPLFIKGVKKSEAREKASAYFEEFGLSGTQKLYPHQLSGGMRQRAALLRTYMFSQEVALLDEPFSALDAITKNEMHKWYLGVMEQIHLSTLFITHDIDEAILISDRIYIMAGKPGRITGELVIDSPHRRDSDFIVSQDFIAYKAQILSILAS